MSSARVALNRAVITGRAVTDSVTKSVKSHDGETTLTVFSIRTPKDVYVGGVIMEIQEWSRTAVQANLVTKVREVAVDGQLTQNGYLKPGRPASKSGWRFVLIDCSCWAEAAKRRIDSGLSSPASWLLGIEVTPRPGRAARSTDWLSGSCRSCR